MGFGKNTILFFFLTEKNNFLGELKIFSGYSFDAEKPYLSIGGVFGAIGASFLQFLVD